jgi:CheY-like chemotaxis protein
MPSTILVVDDSEVVLSVVKAVLEEGGYRVVTQNRANGSLTQIIWERPALVLLDVQMPNLSGVVLARMCAKTVETTGTRVVLHSSLSDEHLQRLVSQCGAFGYIRKTDSPQVLLRQVRKLLKDQPDAPGQRPSSGRIPKAPASPTSGVLLVDRDMEALSSMREVVRGLGLESEFALSARQATDKLQSPTPPQVIVVSDDMPGSGLSDLLQSALRVDASWALRIVVTTRGNPNAIRPEAFEGRIVKKPFEREDLSDAILSALAG